MDYSVVERWDSYYYQVGTFYTFIQSNAVKNGL